VARSAKKPSAPQLIIVYAQLAGPKGQTMLRLALDTGASYTMLPPEKLAIVGYAPQRSKRTVEILTASGAEWTPLLRVSSLRFLGTEVRHIEVVSHTLPPTSPVEGLLGINALRHYKPFREFLRRIHAQ
jgi:predicted aspartyl protease